MCEDKFHRNGGQFLALSAAIAVQLGGVVKTVLVRGSPPKLPVGIVHGASVGPAIAGDDASRGFDLMLNEVRFVKT